MPISSPGSVTGSGQRRTAGATLKDEAGEAIGCLTGWTHTINQDEAEVSCLNSTQGSPPVLKKVYKPNGSDETLSVDGVSKFNSSGQSTVKQAARNGTILTVAFRYYDGSGANYTGFVTNYEETGSKDDFAETFSADFRINDVVE